LIKFIYELLNYKLSKPLNYKPSLPKMSNVSRLEINFKRLLSKCEEISENTMIDYDWRLEKVIYLVNIFNDSKIFPL
jgi:hypothetical protein